MRSMWSTHVSVCNKPKLLWLPDALHCRMLPKEGWFINLCARTISPLAAD